MKTTFLFVIVFFVLGCARPGYAPITENESCSKKYNSKLKRNIYLFVDEMPEFPGGLRGMSRHALKNVGFINDNRDIQGRIRFEMIIDVDGAILDEKIIDKEPDEYTLTDKQVLKNVRSMPKWKPGKCKNRKVPVRVFFPIIVELSE
jgi:protein TonB